MRTQAGEFQHFSRETRSLSEEKEEKEEEGKKQRRSEERPCSLSLAAFSYTS